MRGRGTTTAAGLVALALVVGPASCSFDRSRLDGYARCGAEQGCAEAGRRCVQGYCVPFAALPDLGPPADASRDVSADDLGPADLGPPPQARQTCPAPPFLGDPVLLDGRESEGAGLRFRWQVEAPPGAAPTLVEPDGAPPGGGLAEFRALWPGAYAVRLEVVDALERRATSGVCPLQVPGFELFARRRLQDLAVDGQGRVWVASESGGQRLDPATGAWATVVRTACSAVAVAGESAWFAPSDTDGLLRVPLDANGEGSAQELALPEVQRVRCLQTATDGTLWAGGLGGLRTVVPGPEPTLGPHFDPPGADDEVRAMLREPRGLWLGRASGVCLLTEPGDEACAQERVVLEDVGGGPVDPLIVDLALDAAGALLAATDGKGVHRLGAAGFTPLRPAGVDLSAHRVRFGAAPGGELWLAAGEQLYRLAAGDAVYGVALPSGQQELGPLRSLWVSDSPPALWLAGSAGVARVWTP